MLLYLHVLYWVQFVCLCNKFHIPTVLSNLGIVDSVISYWDRKRATQ